MYEGDFEVVGRALDRLPADVRSAVSTLAADSFSTIRSACTARARRYAARSFCAKAGKKGTLSSPGGHGCSTHTESSSKPNEVSSRSVQHNDQTAAFA